MPAGVWLRGGPRSSGDGHPSAGAPSGAAPSTAPLAADQFAAEGVDEEGAADAEDEEEEEHRGGARRVKEGRECGGGVGAGVGDRPSASGAHGGTGAAGERAGEVGELRPEAGDEARGGAAKLGTRRQARVPRIEQR